MNHPLAGLLYVCFTHCPSSIKRQIYVVLAKYDTPVQNPWVARSCDIATAPKSTQLIQANAADAAQPDSCLRHTSISSCLRDTSAQSARHVPLKHATGPTVRWDQLDTSPRLLQVMSQDCEANTNIDSLPQMDRSRVKVGVADISNREVQGVAAAFSTPMHPSQPSAPPRSVPTQLVTVGFVIESDQMRVVTPLGMWLVRIDLNYREPL